MNSKIERVFPSCRIPVGFQEPTVRCRRCKSSARCNKTLSISTKVRQIPACTSPCQQEQRDGGGISSAARRVCFSCRSRASQADSEVDAPSIYDAAAPPHLRSLRLKDFALVCDECIDFKPGLNVITGESGSGKSVLVEALQLLLGGSASESLIRRPAMSASVEGIFDLPRYEFKMIHAVMGGVVSDQGGNESPHQALLTLTREISVTTRGDLRSRCYVNGKRTRVRDLRKLGEYLVDIAGQHASLELVSNQTQLGLLDTVARTWPLRKRFSELWRSLMRVREHLKRLETLSDHETRGALQEIVEDVIRVNVMPREDEYLRKRLKQMDARREATERCRLVSMNLGGDSFGGGMLDAMYDVERNVKTIIAQETRLSSVEPRRTHDNDDATNNDREIDLEAAKETVECEGVGIGAAERYDNDITNARFLLEGALESLNVARSAVIAAQRSVEKYGKQYRFNPTEYDGVSKRLQDIQKLMKKHDALTLEELLSRAKDAEMALDEYYRAEGKYDELQMYQKDLEAAIAYVGLCLSYRRRRSACILQKTVSDLLVELAMPHTRFELSISWKSSSLNLGESPTNPQSTAEVLVPMSVLENFFRDLGSGDDREFNSVVRKVIDDISQLVRRVQHGECSFLASESGFDTILFLFAAGPEESLLPLGEAASGGETARLMLALKAAPGLVAIKEDENDDIRKVLNRGAVSSLFDSVEHISPQENGGDAWHGSVSHREISPRALDFHAPSVLVLDEIDSGVGARLGHRVGNVLRRMSSAEIGAGRYEEPQKDTKKHHTNNRKHDNDDGGGSGSGGTRVSVNASLSGRSGPSQVLCVSHLPQVAAYAEHHIHVRKERSDDGRVLTLFKTLEDEEERIEEISSMLGLGRDAVEQLFVAVAENS